MTTKVLEDYIEATLSKAAKDMGIESTEYEKVCAGPYVKKLDHVDPEKFRQDVYNTFLAEHDLLPKKAASK